MAIISLLAAHGVQADNLSDAFKNGTVSGDLNLFYKASTTGAAPTAATAPAFLA